MVTLFTLTWKALLKALENCIVCVQTPYAEEQRLLIFHIAVRFIPILKELSMKQETFSSLFSSFDQIENLTHLTSCQAEDYLYLICNHN